jgi:hypothetical protein
MSKNYNKKITATSARLGEVRFSFAHVFERFASEEGKEQKYSVCVLIPKTDTDTIAVINECIEAAKQKGPKKGWPGGKIPAKCASPLRDGDEEWEDKGEAYKGMWFFNCSSKNPVGVRVLENGKVVEALDKEDFYSGCWGAVSVGFFAYDNSGNKGVGVGLNNVIKTRDDERLAGGTSADEDFADMDDTADELD